MLNRGDQRGITVVLVGATLLTGCGPRPQFTYIPPAPLAVIAPSGLRQRPRKYARAG